MSARVTGQDGTRGQRGGAGAVSTPAGEADLEVRVVPAPWRPGADPDPRPGRTRPRDRWARRPRSSRSSLDARVMLARYRRDVLLVDALAAALAASLAI